MGGVGQSEGQLKQSIKTPPAPRDPEQRKALARGYRLRAEVSRLISEEVVLEETRTTLRGLADNYDFMASTLEKMNTSDGRE
ncbi:MAG TPA: hypothetical protein VG274_05820 [Rhizomicrobium sp.]|nr:hypothetical protein [Rhizomicrobium sp.]